MGSVAERAAQLARRAAALTDAQMRVAYVRHELQCMDPDAVADLVLVTASHVEARDASYGQLLLAISVALADPRARELRRSVVGIAAARGQDQVARLLEERTAAAEDANYPVPDFGRGRPLTLGERKALARRPDRQLIARVLRDPHPDVISVLLGNPGVTENDIVRLCARRPVPPEVLREVFRTPRWVTQYRVRRALVRNPYCPLDVALQLASHLNDQDARQVADSAELPDELRRACRRPRDDRTVH